MFEKLTRMCLRHVLLLTLVAVCCHDVYCDDDSVGISYYNLSDFSKMTSYAENEKTQVTFLAFYISKNPVFRRDDFSHPVYQNLTELQFLFSNLTSFTSEPLLGLHQLKYLALENDNLTTIKGHEFAGLHRLQNLSLSSNEIKSISNGAFRDLENLEVLVLSYNKLETINHEMLTVLKSLKEICFNGNSLTYIDENAFSGLTNVNNITLNDNMIEKIDPLAFRNNTNLMSLNLSNNTLESLDSHLFLFNQKLENLNLAGNDLQNLSNFPLPSSLTIVDMKSCNIHQIPEGYFSHLVNLTNLNLANNRISEISVNLLAFPTVVEEVDLSGNELRSVNVASFEQFRTVVKRRRVKKGEELTSVEYQVTWESNPWNCSTSDMLEIRAQEESYLSLFENIFNCH